MRRRRHHGSASVTPGGAVARARASACAATWLRVRAPPRARRRPAGGPPVTRPTTTDAARARRYVRRGRAGAPGRCAAARARAHTGVLRVRRCARAGARARVPPCGPLLVNPRSVSPVLSWSNPSVAGPLCVCTGPASGAAVGTPRPRGRLLAPLSHRRRRAEQCGACVTWLAASARQAHHGSIGRPTEFVVPVRSPRARCAAVPRATAQPSGAPLPVQDLGVLTLCLYISQPY